MSETLAYSYGKQENVAVRVARIFNTYGPRMHSNDGRVVSNFILQALTGQDITVSASAAAADDDDDSWLLTLIFMIMIFFLSWFTFSFFLFFFFLPFF